MMMTKQSSSLFPRPCSCLMLAFALIVALHASCLEAFSPTLTAAGAIKTRQYYSRPLFMANSEEEKEEKQKAPQYDKIMARLQKAEPVAKGAVLLHIEAEDGDAEWDYEPGHILALEIKGQPKDETTHTYEDTMKNNGWMRGPYTVTSSPSNKELQVLLKLVGEKSQAFADAPKGTQIQVGGKFKVPIVEGIDKDSTSQVILLSTGVGVGPCVGAMEKVVETIAAGEKFPPIHLVASFRTEEEVALADKLNQWQEEYPSQISWTPVITSSDQGRVSSSVEHLQDCLTSSPTTTMDLNKTHFHLIGNGELVYEFQKGLAAAGVSEEKVTVEIYFGHQAKAKDETVEIIAKGIQGMASTTSTEEEKTMEVSSSKSS
mmetsp:Transcript_26327/g.64169  ORF Transcript_26327/g.64169 Transcript_26327/m.64169 type:complete len:374 (+) Transcript_26327:159-1280(+)